MSDHKIIEIEDAQLTIEFSKDTVWIIDYGDASHIGRVVFSVEKAPQIIEALQIAQQSFNKPMEKP